MLPTLNVSFVLSKERVGWKLTRSFWVYINCKYSLSTSAVVRSEGGEEPARSAWLWTTMVNWSQATVKKSWYFCLFVCIWFLLLLLFLFQVQGLLCEECLIHEREAGLTQVTEKAPPLHKDSQHVRPELPEFQRRRVMLTVMIIIVTFFLFLFLFGILRL